MSATYSFQIVGQEFKLNKKYTPIKKIGEGAFGIVCAATDDATGERVAIKRIKPIFRDEWEARHTLREITIMRLCEQHPNVICLRGLSLNESEDELYIVMECMFSDLHRIIKHVRPLNLGQIKVILKQILTGLEALHSIGVIHRDLKPGNLLLTKECQVRISDFGLARFYRDVKGRHHTGTLSGMLDYDMSAPSPEEEAAAKGEDAVTMTQYVVTRWYRCPELLLAPHLPYATAVDVWSVGCIFAEMLNGEALFPGSSNPDQVRRILKVLGTPKNHDFGFELHPEAVRFLKNEPNFPGVSWRVSCPHASQDALDLLSGLLTLDPRQRMTVKEALDHPYLSDAPPAPGGTMDLPDFLSLWQRQDLSLDFERKDASLEFLKRCIIREVDMINAPLIFAGGAATSQLAFTTKGGGGGGPAAEAKDEHSHERRSSSSSQQQGGAKAADADTPQARHGHPPPVKKDGSNGSSGSSKMSTTIQQMLGRASGAGGGNADAAGKVTAEDKHQGGGGDDKQQQQHLAGEAEAKPTKRRSSFFRASK